MRAALFSLLTVLVLTLAVVPAMADTLYSNGPYNGTTDAWSINFGFSVSDSFVVPDSFIQGLHLVYWDASAADILTTVDMAIGSSSFGGTPQTLSGVTNTFISANQYGYNLYQADYSFSDIRWNLAGYVTLSNACSTSGCSVSNSIYWDENSGPSTAYDSTLGSIPSESFTVSGVVCGCCGIAGGKGPNCSETPEPSNLMLFGSGILGFVGILRRKLGR